jgi:hypothetical protein
VIIERVFTTMESKKMSIGDVLINSLGDGYNIIIIIAAVFAILVLVLTLLLAGCIRKHFDSTNGEGLKRFLYYMSDVSYTVFITIISLFPLFGMLGTVLSLIGIGNDNSFDLNGMKSNFFLALTSTAWGIIFSLLFKFINSFVQPYLENQISKAKSSLDI